MGKHNSQAAGNPEENVHQSPLDEVVRKGAQEVEEHDEPRFRSNLIPPYLRRTKNMDEFLPFLYLKGVSTKDFTEVLKKLLGKKLPGFSAQQICRSKEFWRQEYEDWAKRDLSIERYVHWWVDGIYFNVRLEEDARQCILVIIAAKEDGSKELLAVQDGFRESKESWASFIRNLKHRGLRDAPHLATGDGALGFWTALDEEFPETRKQICWVHKTANVLDKLPKMLQPKAKLMIQDIHMAPSKREAENAFDYFVEEFSAKYPKAAQSLTDHRQDLLSFYDFPAEQRVKSTYYGPRPVMMGKSEPSLFPLFPFFCNVDFK